MSAIQTVGLRKVHPLASPNVGMIVARRLGYRSFYKRAIG